MRQSSPATDLAAANQELKRLRGELSLAESRCNIALQKQEGTLRFIEEIHQGWLKAFDAVPDPIFMHDRQLRITRSNKAYAEKAGLKFKELIGRPYWEIFPKRPGPLPGCAEAIKDPRQGHAHEEEFQLETGAMYVSRASHTFDSNGEYQYSIHILHDITERKLAEIALDHANRALATLGAVNRELVHATDENELLQSVCLVIVEQHGYRLAWVAYAQHDESLSIKIMAHAGQEKGYLETLQLTWAETERGM
jgi:PAS domain S-box-containing protein